MTRDELIEALNAAIYQSMDHMDKVDAIASEKYATAALTALEAAGIDIEALLSGEKVLVPKVPTEAMLYVINTVLLNDLSYTEGKLALERGDNTEFYEDLLKAANPNPNPTHELALEVADNDALVKHLMGEDEK